MKRSSRKIEARQLFTSIDCLLASVNSALPPPPAQSPSGAELILFLGLWHFIIGLGKAVLLVLLICTLIYFLLFLFAIPLHSQHAHVLGVYSLTGVYCELLLCVVCIYVFAFGL